MLDFFCKNTDVWIISCQNILKNMLFNRKNKKIKFIFKWFIEILMLFHKNLKVFGGGDSVCGPFKKSCTVNRCHKDPRLNLLCCKAKFINMLFKTTKIHTLTFVQNCLRKFLWISNKIKSRKLFFFKWKLIITE